MSIPVVDHLPDERRDPRVLSKRPPLIELEGGPATIEWIEAAIAEGQREDLR